MNRFDREPKDIMQVDDISRRSRYVDKTDRMTDPMNPVYQVNYCIRTKISIVEM